MRRLKTAAPLLYIAAALMTGITLHAQTTVTVGPTGYVTAGPGGTQQFTAQAHGFTGDGSATFIWLVSGKVGGNSTIGTISSTGLYTAPTTIPASGMETITAQLASNTKITGTQYIYLLNAGPQLTSVTQTRSPSAPSASQSPAAASSPPYPSSSEACSSLLLRSLPLSSKRLCIRVRPPARPSWPEIPTPSMATRSPFP